MQWLAMLLLLLPLPLLLGAPLGSTEGAAAKLTPERVLEWQGEYASGRRDRIGTCRLGCGGQGKGGGRGQRERPGLDGDRISALLRKPRGWVSPAHRLVLHPFF